MANPLLSYASEVTPVQPTTRFFDPSPGLNVMQRYGMSGRARAVAEDSLKSANEIDAAANFDPVNRRNDLERHEWLRQAKDREDLAYEEKKDFENTLGTFLVDVAKLDEEDPEFDQKLAGYVSDPRALDNDAVKAIFNLKVQQRDEKFRLKEITAARNNSVLESWASAGFDPADITDETGRFSPDKAAQAKRRVDTSTIMSKYAEQDREERLKLYNGDKDVADATTAEQVAPIYETRRKTFADSVKASGTKTAIDPASPEFDKLLADAPALTADGFVARLMNFDPSDASLEGITNPTERIVRIMGMGSGTRDPKLMPMVKSAMDLFNAAHARGRLPQSNKPATSPEPKRNPTANKYFE